MHRIVSSKIKLSRVVLTVLLTALMVVISFAFSGINAFADSEEEEGDNYYVNKTTYYEAIIIDEAGLLTDGEKRSLIEDMQPITEYGNVMFYTIDKNKGTTIYEGQRKLEELFGSSPNGTVFIIDMANRELSVYSDGAIYKPSQEVRLQLSYQMFIERLLRADIMIAQAKSLRKKQLCSREQELRHL